MLFVVTEEPNEGWSALLLHPCVVIFILVPIIALVTQFIALLHYEDNNNNNNHIEKWTASQTALWRWTASQRSQTSRQPLLRRWTPDLECYFHWLSHRSVSLLLRSIKKRATKQQHRKWTAGQMPLWRWTQVPQRIRLPQTFRLFGAWMPPFHLLILSAIPSSSCVINSFGLAIFAPSGAVSSSRFCAVQRHFVHLSELLICIISAGDWGLYNAVHIRLVTCGRSRKHVHVNWRHNTCSAVM